MDQISWGIIGCGDVTEKKSGPAFNKVKNSTLHAVMRRSADKAKDYASRHGVPRWYNNANDLINDPDVNAVYIATPPSSHEEYAIAAMKAGKSVYIEKPMSTNAAGARRICEAASSMNIRVSIAHYRRQLPIFKKVKELIDSKYIGDIQFIHLRYFQPVNVAGFEPGPQNWRLIPSISGGGFFHDLSPHQLDLMCYFFGKPVYADGISRNQAGLYEPADTTTGIIAFPDNVLMNGMWSFVVTSSEAMDSCRITGTKGSLEFSVFGMDKITINREGKREELPFDRVPHVQQPLIEKIVEFFLREGPNPCSCEDGVVVMDLIDSFNKR